MASDGKDCSCCCVSGANNSVRQTLDEMDWERGIWNAAMTGDQARALLLLERGGDKVATAEDNAGYTGLHYASRNGHLAICQMLLEYGAHVNAQTRCGRATPLHRAAALGHTEVVKLLLCAGANPTIQDEDGQTALHKAAKYGDLTIIGILVKASPKLKEVKDSNGRVPYDFLPVIPPDETLM